ncbi:hypothetical protein K458DRAFT_413345 [Lentithecium fluviatile CBS 122367]|uniref:Uncharacterized protein n=1 Tax=Lentithecium fluviatile CBS 122367 TaxID=1168545 RepID=A0A6G1JEM2_9PLEO|nr:hypothetical protein K458DRAFT_413345 [Lentithecium fluviatile CBS 122367]
MLQRRRTPNGSSAIHHPTVSDWDWSAFRTTTTDPETQIQLPQPHSNPNTATTKNLTSSTTTNPSTSATPAPPTTLNTTTDSDPLARDLDTLNAAFRFAITWLCPSSPSPSLGAALQILWASARKDTGVREVVVAVLRQDATGRQWEAFRGFARNARRQVKIEEKAQRRREREEDGGGPARGYRDGNREG